MEHRLFAANLKLHYETVTVAGRASRPLTRIRHEIVALLQYPGGMVPASQLPGPPMFQYRAIWLSDLHLGSRHCRAAELARYVANLSCRKLYLVGDIIDLESLEREFYWPSLHSGILAKFLDLARSGTEVTYIPGNHDMALRRLAGQRISNIEIRLRTAHVTAAGHKLLVTHGDEFDAAVRCGLLAKFAGSLGYRQLLRINHWVNEGRALTGRPHWSLARRVKNRIAGAHHYVGRFKRAATSAAADAGFDGVICGHVHLPELDTQDGILYANDGDWIEHGTALAEDHAGRLTLLAPGDDPVQAATPAGALPDAA